MTCFIFQVRNLLRTHHHIGGGDTLILVSRQVAVRFPSYLGQCKEYRYCTNYLLFQESVEKVVRFLAPGLKVFTSELGLSYYYSTGHLLLGM